MFGIAPHIHLFHVRLQEDAARRQASLKSRSAAQYQDWTFQPTLSPASQRVVGESPWAGASAAKKSWSHKCVESGVTLDTWLFFPATMADGRSR